MPEKKGSTSKEDKKVMEDIAELIASRAEIVKKARDARTFLETADIRTSEIEEAIQTLCPERSALGECLHPQRKTGIVHELAEHITLYCDMNECPYFLLALK